MADKLFNNPYGTDQGTNKIYESRGTSINSRKLACERKGGTWDETTGTCIMPNVDLTKGLLNQPPKTQAPKPLTPQEIMSLPVGKGTPIQDNEQSSVSKPDKIINFLPNGNVRVAIGNVEKELTPAEYKRYESGRGKITPNVLALETAPSASQQQAQLLASQLTGEPALTEQDILNAVPQEPGLENIQAGAAGTFGALAGAKYGAAAGTVFGPAGTLAGGILGALGGAIGGAYVKIGYDKRSDVKQAKKVGTIANTNFGQTIDSLNAGLISRDVALQRWKENRIALYAARANLKKETDTDLNRFLSGGADELAQIEDYIDDLETIYQFEFSQALAAPNPANIKYLHQQDIEELNG